MDLTAMDIPTIGAKLEAMRKKLNAVHVQSAEGPATLEDIAKDAEELAAFARRFVDPATLTPKLGARRAGETQAQADARRVQEVRDAQGLIIHNVPQGQDAVDSVGVLLRKEQDARNVLGVPSRETRTEREAREEAEARDPRTARDILIAEGARVAAAPLRPAGEAEADRKVREARELRELREARETRDAEEARKAVAEDKAAIAEIDAGLAIDSPAPRRGPRP